MNQTLHSPAFARLLLLLLFTSQFISGANAQQWSALGAGVDGFAWEMAEYHGDLYLGGNLLSTDSTRVGLLRWNGTTFDTLPGTYQYGPNFIVYDLAVYNDELYFCGTMAGSPKIAKWDGSAFRTVPNSFPATVSHLEVFQGELYATSSTTVVSGITANGIMRWNGSQWSGVGGGVCPNPHIYGLEVYGNELYATGSLYFAPDQSYGVARWDGVQWRGVGPGGVTGTIQSVCNYNGELYIAGASCQLAGGVPIDGIARWNGSTWAPVTTSRTHIDQYEDLCAYNGELYVSGNFVAIEGDTMRSISRYSGGAWHDVGGGTDFAFSSVDTLTGGNGDTIVRSSHTITAMCEMGGELYVCGIFDQIGGIPAHHVAKWSAPVHAADPSTAQAWSIYPNPATDRISLAGPSAHLPSSIQIHDLQGRILHTQQLPASTEIDVSTLHPGIYLLQITTGHNTTTQKLAIKR